MTTAMPEISALVTLMVGEDVFDTMVELVDGKTAVVAAPFHETVEIPSIGATVTLSWSAGKRGRYVVQTKLMSTARVDGAPARCWSLTFDSEPVLQQRRRFVRAGGGELVRVRTPNGSAKLSGAATDISEGGVRFRIDGAKPNDDSWSRLDEGEDVTAVIQLGNDMLEADGSVLRVIEDPIRSSVDMIVTLHLSERQADLVRRYVMHRQILARRAAAEADY